MTSPKPQAHKPAYFVSPGLRSLISRMGIASEPDISSLEKLSEGKMLLSAMFGEGWSSKAVLATISAMLGMPFHELECQATLRKVNQSGLVGKFECQHALDYRYLPLGIEGPNVIVAFADPLDVDTINDLRFKLSRPVKVHICPEEDIVSILSKLLGVQDMEDAVSDDSSFSFQLSSDSELTVGPGRGGAEGEGQDSSTAMVRLVNDMLYAASSTGVSDIHLEPARDGLHIKFRHDGVLHPYLSVSKKLQPYILARLKLLARMDITERNKPQDGRFRFSTASGDAVDLRINTVPTPHGEKIAIRLLASEERNWCFEALGMTLEMERTLRRIMEIRDRLTVVTGPTGSGKSTTLYTCVYELMREERNIITVEDPVEYRIDGITQIQINNDRGMTFVEGLRSILRQDPEVILVGEIRDGETASCALQAAQTGHQVLSSLHTSTAPSAVTRLMDLKVPPYLIASSLGAVIAQRLVRTLCPDCREPLNAKERGELAATYGIVGSGACKNRGCPKCNNSGFRGRRAIFSLLDVSEEMQELIRSGGSEREIEISARKGIYRSLAADGLTKVTDGVTTIEEVVRVMGAVCVENAIEEYRKDRAG